MKLLALVGRGFLLLASMAFLTGVSLFVVGAYLATWPLMRKSPRNARMQSVIDMAVALMGVVRAYGLDRMVTDQFEDSGEESASEVAPNSA